MASDRSSNPPSPKPGVKPAVRTSPVLVPQGALEGQPEIPLNRPVTTVGSNEGARLHLLSRTVSKGHAIFVNSNGATYVADLASRTGTLVNGKAVRDAELKNGDRVQIGKFVFRYRMPANLGSAAQAVEAPPAAVIVVGWPALPIPGRAVSLGRESRADISLSDDSAVSASHAVIFQVDGQWLIRDMGSRTGTLINGQKIHQQVLNFGDRVTIGSSTILFQPGANIEDEFSASEPPNVEENFAEHAEVEPLEQIAPAARVASVSNDDQISLTDEEPLHVVDWKTAFPLPVPELSEASASHNALPFEEPMVEEATRLDIVEPEPFPADQVREAESAEWSATTAVDSPLDEESLPLEPQAVPEPFDWNPTPASELPAEIVGQAAIPSVVEEPLADIQSQSAPIELVAETAEHEPSAESETIETSVLSEIAPVALESHAPVEGTEPAIPLADETDVDVIDWGEISDVDAPEDNAEYLPPTVKPTQVKESTAEAESTLEEQPETVQTPVPVIDELADDSIDWNAISTAEDPVGIEPALIETDQPIAALTSSEVDWNATVAAEFPVEETATEVERPASPADALESLSPNDLVEIQPHEEPPIAADSSAVEEISSINPEVIPVAQSPVETWPFPAVDPHAPLEEFVFVPADAPADPNAVPEVLFWGDPEADAVSQLAATSLFPASLGEVAEVPLTPQPQAAPTPPSIEPAAATDAAFDALMDETFANADDSPIAVEPQTESGSPVVESFAPITPDAAFDAAMEESFATVDEEAISLMPEATPAPAEIISELPAAIEINEDDVFDGATEDSLAGADKNLAASILDLETPSPEQFLEQEEISIPSDLAAFSRASETTAESYGDTAPHTPLAAKPFALPGPEEANAAVEELPEFIDVAAEPANESLDPVDLDFLETETQVATSDESAIGWTALADQDEPAGEEHITVSEDLTVQPVAETDEADLDFFDSSEASAEVALPVEDSLKPPAVDGTPGAPAPIAETPKPLAAPDGPAHGPSIFGIQFEGGSFLGGMPISLHEPEPISPKSSTVFNAKQLTPSGLDTMAAPPLVEAIESPIVEPPMVEQTTPPVIPRSSRPMTPPRPALGSPAVAIAPTSLTGLVSEARVPWSGPPVIPPTVRSDAPKTQTRVRQRMTTAFAASGKAPRTAEVFSQMAAPIGVEVFGGKPGNPNQFTVPDSKESAAELAAQAEAVVPVTVASVVSAKKQRKSRLPWLAVLFVVLPAGLWALTYEVPPVSSRLVSAKLMGSLQYDGLTNVPATVGEIFRRDQEKRLYSEDVRTAAQMILQQKQKPDGFTENSDDYAKVVNNQYLNWSGNTLQLSLNTSDAEAGSAQINAVLVALAQKDRDLDDNRIRARAAANNAQAVADDSAARAEKLSEQRRTLLDQAQDSPDLSTVTDSDQEATALTKKWNDAKAMRENSEAILADLRSQDTGKPIDIEADPQVVDLKKRLDPLIEQIARLKGISAINAGATATVGTNISQGATTQPAGDVDPLLAPLQQQADLLNKKLDQRRNELASDASMSPAQREVNMASRIENLSVKITAMQKAESDAKVAADAAIAKAADNHAKMSNARLAGVKAEELYTQQNEAQADHTRAIQNQSDKEAALASCVTVAGVPGMPVLVGPPTDLRRPILAGGSALSCFILGLMIAGELRRPKQMVVGVTPAAAPLVHPPARVIPWPQPSELSGLESTSNDPSIIGEPDQVFGTV